jgi:hypothetical protein
VKASDRSESQAKNQSLMARWIDYGKEAWVFLFVASFVLSIIAGLIQHSRRQEPSESPMIPLLAVLHFLWVWILTLWLIASAIYSI